MVTFCVVGVEEHRLKHAPIVLPDPERDLVFRTRVATFSAVALRLRQMPVISCPQRDH